MTTPIGYATLQIIPVLKDVSAQIDKQLGGALTVSGKRSGVQFGRGVADGLKASEADVKRATDAYGKLADKAKDSLGQIAVAEAKLEKARAGGKTDMIVAAEERLAKVRRDSLRTSKEAEAAHSALIAMQGRLGSSTDDLGGRFSGLSGMASSAGTALLSVGTLAGGAALVGITAFAAGAVAATKELYDLGASFDDLRDKLQISTGASGAQLEGLVATVERLGTTNVASKFGGIGDVAADVTRNLHLTGPALDDVTSRLANWDRMTGDAVNVRELGKAFRGFGVDAADQAGALDSLAGMSQKTGLSVNELIGAVNKGAPALREFGFGFGESAALVGQLDAAGLNAEKMLKGPLNTALVQLRKEGKTGADGLKGIVDQIQALLAAGDRLGARGLAEKYFGTKGATDFFDAIRSGNLDLANLSTSLQATGTDINQLAKDTGDGAQRFTLLRNRIEKALEPLGTTVFDSVNAGLDKLAGWVESHQGEIVGAFVSIGDAVISMATGTLRGLGEMTEAFGGFIGILGDVQGAVLKLESAQARFRGDTAQADELHRQSEEAFGWGENIAKLGQDMKETARKGGEWKTSLRELGEEAKNAATATATLNRTVVDGKQVFGPFAGSPFISGASSGGTPPAGGGGVPLTQTAAGAWTSTNPEWAKLITRESGGNPTIQNTTDSNARAGNPSKGLFQFTDTTWIASGGGKYAPSADLASPQQQAEIAANLLRRNPSGSDWGLDQNIGREDASKLLAGLGTGGGGVQLSSPNLPDVRGAHPQLASVLGALQQMSPGLTLNAGMTDHDKDSGWHPKGQAIDIGGTPEQMAQVSNMLLQYAPYIEELIHSGRGVSQNIKSGKLGPAIDMPGSVYSTGQAGYHGDHIHLAIRDEMATAFEQALKAVGWTKEEAAQVRREALGANTSSPIDLSRNTLSTADETSSVTRSSTGAGLKFPSLTNFSGIGGALGEFAGGQLGSALDVFGVGDSPGWLQGIGQLMGGISIGGGGGGGSVSPLSALGTSGPAASLTGAHGGTGAQPGPAGVTYNINNNGGNDDLITLLRRREQELGAMLGRF